MSEDSPRLSVAGAGLRCRDAGCRAALSRVLGHEQLDRPVGDLKATVGQLGHRRQPQPDEQDEEQRDGCERLQIRRAPHLGQEGLNRVCSHLGTCCVLNIGPVPEVRAGEFSLLVRGERRHVGETPARAECQL